MAAPAQRSTTNKLPPLSLPPPLPAPPAHPGEVDCVIVPCVALDGQCRRLGHGGGYYDSFLARTAAKRAELGLPPPVTVGLALRDQVVESVPVGPLDRRIDVVVHPDATVFAGEVAASGAPMLLDCRNSYESDVGSFVGALPLETKAFSDSWAKLEDMLVGTPKDTPILTFCTGGIRCVKTNA